MDDAGIAEFDAFDTDWCEQNDRRRAYPGGVRETYYSAGYRAGSNALEASRAECARLRVAWAQGCISDHAHGSVCENLRDLTGVSMEEHEADMRAALNGAADATVGSATTDEPIPGSRQAFIKAMQERG